MELLKKEAKMGVWGTSKGIRLPKSILEVMDFSNDEVELSVELNENGKKQLVITEAPTVEDEQDNYSEEEMKYIRLLVDEAFDDIHNGRTYSIDEMKKWLVGEM
jgi:antitoxin component of MazEF toxin-antitoxin module